MGSYNIASQLNVGNVSGNSYFRIEEDGSIQMLGDASMWADLRVPVTQTKLGANLKPDFDFTFKKKKIKMLAKGYSMQEVHVAPVRTSK